METLTMWENALKPTLKFLGIHKVKHKVKFLLDKKKLSNKNPQNIFTDIYKNNDWKGAESISGQGSDLLETTVLLNKLPSFLDKHQIKTLVDLPCGDHNWIQHLEYKFDQYIGIDIVEDIIKDNNKNYISDEKIFIQKNCLTDKINDADLILCRDLLIHFSDEDIFRFLNNLKNSNITYLLTTHFTECKNYDIATGQWRPINLEAPPFNFPKPIESIIEETKMYDGKYAATKTMSLWKLEDIYKIL